MHSFFVLSSLKQDAAFTDSLAPITDALWVVPFESGLAGTASPARVVRRPSAASAARTVSAPDGAHSITVSRLAHLATSPVPPQARVR
jgi:hypothetical protein